MLFQNGSNVWGFRYFLRGFIHKMTQPKKRYYDLISLRILPMSRRIIKAELHTRALRSKLLNYKVFERKFACRYD
jgi:hypothetical protein